MPDAPGGGRVNCLLFTRGVVYLRSHNRPIKYPDYLTSFNSGTSGIFEITYTQADYKHLLFLIHFWYWQDSKAKV